MKKFCLRGLALLALGLVMLSGCGSKPTPEPVRITLMHGWGGSAPDHLVMRSLYDDFQEQNPDIILECVAYPDVSVVLDKASDMLALGEMPDIISTNGFRSLVDGAIRRGLALDFSPYLAADPALDACVSRASKDAWSTAEGSIYTISDAQEIAGYWYNEDLLRQAGVTQDGTAQSAVRLPATWEEFWDACDAVAQWSEQQQTDVLPAALSPFQTKMLLGALIAAGGDDGTKFMQGTAANCPKELLDNALAGVAHAYAVTGEQTVTENNARQMFFEGRTVFFFGGVWAHAELAITEREQNIKCAAYPGPSGQSIAYITPSSGYVVSNAGSPEKIEACIRFIKYIISDETQRRIVVESRQAPSNPAVDTEWITAQAPILGQALQVCYQSPIHIIAFPTLLDERTDQILDACIGYPLPMQEDLLALYTILT